jgi:hypothetical protein
MHNRPHISILFTRLLLIGIILGGCDETGLGGSESVSLLKGEPVILDSALAVNVNDDRPDGIADTFFDTSDRIYLWIFWVNVQGRHTVEINWFSPEDDSDAPPFREDQETFTSSTGDQITWFFIDPPSTGFSEGDWRVEILLDGLFERSHLFFVNE